MSIPHSTYIPDSTRKAIGFRDLRNGFYWANRNADGTCCILAREGNPNCCGPLFAQGIHFHVCGSDKTFREGAD